MSDTEFIIAATLPFVIIGSFILLGIWQLLKLKDPDNYTINPRSIAPFKKYADPQTDWLVARVRQWPPIKCKISFCNRLPFIEVKRVRDQCGLISVYKNNKELIGQIKIYNSYKAYIERHEREIHAIPDLADFINFCRKISYVLPETGHTILSITPYLDLGQKLEYSFTIDGKSFILKSGLSDYRLSASLFCDGIVQAIFAVVTAKQITAAILLSEPNYLALLLCFDIFNRRAS